MEIIDSMQKIEEMLELYDSDKVLNITVIKHKSAWPVGLNTEEDGGNAVIEEPVVLSVDAKGVTYISEDDEEGADLVPVAIDYTDVLYIGTQQSCNMKKKKGKEVIAVDDIEGDVQDVFSSEDEDLYFNTGEYRPELRAEERARGIAAELELIQKLKKQKKEAEMRPEDADILEKLAEQKKQREDPFLHFEGDTDVEELFEEEEESEVEEIPDAEYFQEKKKQKPARPGPTSSSHYEVVKVEDKYFMPTSDEDSSPDELGDSEDDGFVPRFVLPNGRKRKLKKIKKRVWYDESRADPHEQMALKVCFTDVYQFRRALRTFHIAQLRNFAYWRNNSDRIIVHCSERKKGCPFYMTASKIAHEHTFCIRKMRGQHTCIAHGENTKVTIDWVAKESEQAVRSNPNTTVDTLIDNAKHKWGIEIPKSKAYRARMKAFQVVMGDQRAQYTRLRDYLQAVIDSNPGSRCIVTTRHLVEHPSPTPRFHGLFFCLNASKEGFLNGCRPFIGNLFHIFLSITSFYISLHVC
jgi:hypothetical protein